MAEPTLTDVMNVLAPMQGGFSALRGEATSPRAEVANLRADVASLCAELAALRAELDAVKEEQARFREELDGLRVEPMGRMDRLQDGLTQRHEDNLAAFGRTERLERRPQTVSDLEREITGIHRQIFSLQQEVRQLRGEH